jgi:peptide deformylase
MDSMGYERRISSSNIPNNPKSPLKLAIDWQPTGKSVAWRREFNRGERWRWESDRRLIRFLSVLVFSMILARNNGVVKIHFLIVTVTFCMFTHGQVSWAQESNWKPSLASVGDSILKRKSLALENRYFSSSELEQFTVVLAREMFSHFRILGIAAPQMSTGLRIFLLRSSFINPFNHSYEVFINPVITPVGDATDSGIEFCLSASGFHRIRRYKTIQLEFSKIDGTRKVIELTGSRARIAQHEMDHLDGKLISEE